MHLVGFIIGMYHDTRSPERQIMFYASNKSRDNKYFRLTKLRKLGPSSLQTAHPVLTVYVLGLLLRIREVQAVLTNVLSSVHPIKIQDSRRTSNSKRPLSFTPVSVHYSELLIVSLCNKYLNQYTVKENSVLRKVWLVLGC